MWAEAGREAQGLSCAHRTAQLCRQNTKGCLRTGGAVVPPTGCTSASASPTSHTPASAAAWSEGNGGMWTPKLGPECSPLPFAGLHFSIPVLICRSIHCAHGKRCICIPPAVPEPWDRDIKLWGHSKVVRDTLALLLRPSIRKGESSGQMDDVYIKK